MKHHFELISFPICPYVQRSVIILKMKKVPFKITHIDLAIPPSWFEEISPLGQVPVLRVDQQEIIFESAVIGELIDDLTENRLQHSDPIARAKEKAWVEYGSSLLGEQYLLSRETDPKTAEELKGEFLKSLMRVESVLGSGPFFRGKQFSLVDAAYAPLLMRMKILPGLMQDLDWKEIPRIAAWSETLLELPEVRGSVLPSFRDDYLNYLRKAESVWIK